MSVTCKVPELRFGEFSGEWESVKLERLGSFQGGGTPRTTEKEYWIGKIPWISSSDINDDDIKNINVTRYINETAIKESATKLIPKGSVLFVSRVGVGKLAIANVDLCTSQDFANLTLKNVNSQYIAYYFLANKTLLIRYSQGTSIKGFTTNDIKTLKLNLPSKPEQEKIALFLSSVDSRIAQLTKKEQLLREYKKGVMQKIFSQELRFHPKGISSQAQGTDDDGSEFPEWVEKKLGDIGITYNGLTGKTSENFGSGKPYIQYKQIFDNARISVNGFGYVFIEPNEKQNKAQFGDIFFTTSSETPNEVGFASVLLDDIKEVYLNSFCFGYRVKLLDILNPYFAKFLFRSANFRRKVIKLAQGSTRYNISKIALMKIFIQLPSLEEQTKIANFLSSLDTKIEQVNKELNLTKEFKKALLQQMFV